MASQEEAIVQELGSPTEDGVILSLFEVWEELKKKRKEDPGLDINDLFGRICDAQERPDALKSPTYGTGVFLLALPSPSKIWKKARRLVRRYKLYPVGDPKQQKILLFELHVPRDEAAGSNRGSVTYKIERTTENGHGVELRVFGNGGGGGILREIYTAMTKTGIKECQGVFTEVQVQNVELRHRYKIWKKNYDVVIRTTGVERKMFEEKLGSQGCQSCRLVRSGEDVEKIIHGGARAWETNERNCGVSDRVMDMGFAEQTRWSLNLGPEFKDCSLRVSLTQSENAGRVVTWTFPAGTINYPVSDRPLNEARGVFPHFVSKEIEEKKQSEQ